MKSRKAALNLSILPLIVCGVLTMPVTPIVAQTKSPTKPPAKTPAPVVVNVKYGDTTEREVRNNVPLHFKFSGKKSDVFLLNADINGYSWVTLTMFKADGTRLMHVPEGEGAALTGALPDDGIYTVVVRPGYTGILTVKLQKAIPLKRDEEVGDLLTFTEESSPERLYSIKANGPFTLKYRRLSGDIDLKIALTRVNQESQAVEEVAALYGAYLDGGSLSADMGSEDTFVLTIRKNQTDEYLTTTGRVRFSLKLAASEAATKEE